ncbi:ABC transporter, nucleotide binding/ATPase protein [Fulvimarina pelagi HTCC2506]|uniref:ABC transporter, nucleotide binding/ATPase protein n=1 Tax=Fulvimarina pelagi HTCC2506 TaxID=314231 RepID=Q0FY87_9HYPH|nr:urea ABC transporter ATP-binding subunit UrtE [Fulvimarina pelagi]EAU39855.1 ABC transporter, nucleotide binding/ATPase protein [Fulvimarina pelagi HTCC2506]
MSALARDRLKEPDIVLEARNLYSYYGKSVVLQDLNFDLEPGSMLAVLGRNGVGKTTLLRTIMGLTDRTKGDLFFSGEPLGDRRTDERAMMGIGYVPQGREVVPRFTVAENLKMGTFARKDGKRAIPDKVFDLFPILKEFSERRGGDLSGGQQQQLAIGRALAMNPKMLLLDEPTEGIQPNIVQEIEEVIQTLNVEHGLTIVLVEQNIDFARRACDRFLVMDKGQVVVSGRGEDLNDEIANKHLTF